MTMVLLRTIRAGTRFASVAVLSAGLAVPLQAQLHSQTQLVTHPGAGAGGADVSAVQSGSLGLFSSGFFTSPNQSRYAEGFTIDAGSWDITGFRFFAWRYRSSEYTTASWQLWSEYPKRATAVVMAGDLNFNSYVSSTSTGIYRVSEGDLTNTDREIFAIDAAASLTLGVGRYWLEWTLDGPGNVGGFGVHLPPITELGVAQTGSALVWDVGSGTWADVVDFNAGTGQGLPFEVLGRSNGDGRGDPIPMPVPEPALGGLLLLGSIGLAVSRRSVRAA